MIEQTDRDVLVALHFYPNGMARTACPSDEDGAPTCMGDAGYCGHSKVLDRQVCAHLNNQPDL